MDLPSTNNFGELGFNSLVKKDDEDFSDSLSNSSDSSDGMPTEEDVFEVEKIIGHKVSDCKDYWKIRWVGYGPSDDTWEPRENFLDKKVLKMLNDFEVERLAKKEKRKELSRKSIEYSLVQNKHEDNDMEVKDEKNDSWFGIKPDEGTLEQRRLFVPDRRLSKTEKLLTEIGSSPGVRILRKHLKEPSVSPKIDETALRKAVYKPRKRRRNDDSSDFIFTSESSARENSEKIGNETVLNTSTRKKIKMEEEILESHKRLKHADNEEGTHNSELGISKNLMSKKLTKLGQKQKLKVSPKKEEICKKKNKEEKVVLKKSESSSHKPKDKLLSKLAVVKPGETGLMVPFAYDGINLVAAIEHLTVEKQSSFSFVDNPSSVSQEEFEEMVMDGKVEKVRQLLYGQAAKGFDLNRVDEFGKTLLHKLCEVKCGVSHTQCELIDLLVACGGRLNIIENGNGQIPLHIAIANRRLCHVRQLLNLRSPVNLVDRSGKSPLILSLDCSDSEFTRCLLKAGASFQPALEKLFEDKDRNKRLRFITEHEAQLRKSLNAARDAVSLNLSVKCISPIFVNPIHENESVHCFYLKSQPQLPVGDSAYLLLASLAEFLQDDREKDSNLVEARMWGQSPIQSITINGKICQQLKQGNKFVFLCSPGKGENQIKINLETIVRKSNNILLTQVVLAQFFRQTRPSTGHSAPSSFNSK